MKNGKQWQFLGMPEALRRDWIIMEYPPPSWVLLKEREAYELRFQRLRKFGAVVIDVKASKQEATRTWYFGRPRGEVDACWMRELAEKAGMLRASSDPSFTFKWLWRDTVNMSLEERLTFWNDALTDKLHTLSRIERIPEIYRREMRAVAQSWEFNQLKINELCVPLRTKTAVSLEPIPQSSERVIRGWREIGRLGGLAKAARLTREARSQNAKILAEARWKKKRKR